MVLVHLAGNRTVRSVVCSRKHYIPRFITLGKQHDCYCTEVRCAGTQQMSGTIFHHELEWYEYQFIEEMDKVGVCETGICTGMPSKCKIFYYTKQKLEELIQIHKWNPFLLPIFQEAIKHFPKGDEHAIR